MSKNDEEINEIITEMLSLIDKTHNICDSSFFVFFGLLFVLMITALYVLPNDSTIFYFIFMFLLMAAIFEQSERRNHSTHILKILDRLKNTSTEDKEVTKAKLVVIKDMLEFIS